MSSFLFLNFIKWISPSNSNSNSSVNTYIIVLVCLPMLFLTDFGNPLQRCCTLFLLPNIFLRLWFPSTYYPASASTPAFYASPIFHRFIAFIAEFLLYELWAVWIDVHFWSHSTHLWLWLIVFIAECISTTGVILQNQFLLLIEDFLWTLHAAYMSYLSIWQKRTYPSIFFVGFTFFLFFFHLPPRISLLIKDSFKTSLFHTNPLFSSGSVSIHPSPTQEKLWVVPMLLSQPLLTAFIFYSLKSQN